MHRTMFFLTKTLILLTLLFELTLAQVSCSTFTENQVENPLTCDLCKFTFCKFGFFLFF